MLLGDSAVERGGLTGSRHFDAQSRLVAVVGDVRELENPALWLSAVDRSVGDAGKQMLQLQLFVENLYN